jgi:hypothetical protein
MKKYLFFVLLLLASTSHAQETLKGNYTLTSVATAKRLDGNATTLYPSDPNSGDYQKWTIKQTGTTGGRKVYRLTSVATGKCLDYDGERIYPRGLDDSRTQLWILDPAGCPNCYTLTNLPTGKRLDGNAGGLYAHDPNDGNYQKWRIEPIAPNTSTVSSAITDVGSAKSLATGPDITQKVLHFGDWSNWQKTGFGQFRWRWFANTTEADFPKFVYVEYEVQNKRQSTVNAVAGVKQCKNPELTSKQQQQFTLDSQKSGVYKVKVLNCGTKESPKVQPIVWELIRID